MSDKKAGWDLLVLLIIALPVSLDFSLALQECGTYVLVTVAGSVTPGAPAGFGVRKAVLYSCRYTRSHSRIC